MTVTGHSLGAGVATILSLKLINEYPNLKCIAYSPPGGLISEALADYTKSFVMSVVIGDDIVPRLSLHSVHNLKAKILKVLIRLKNLIINRNKENIPFLKEIYKSNLPKYKIIWKYSLSFVRSPAKNGDIVQYASSDESETEEITAVSVANLRSAPRTSNNIVFDETMQDHYVDDSTDDKINLCEATSLEIKQEAQKIKLHASRVFKNSSNLVEIDDFKQGNYFNNIF